MTDRRGTHIRLGREIHEAGELPSASELEEFDNRIRRHTSLGKLSPERFEERYRSAPAVAAG